MQLQKEKLLLTQLINVKMRILISVIIVCLAFACGSSGEEVKSKQAQTLPFLGQRDIVDGDTVYHQISDFSFVNQDSQKVTNETFKDKIYITDFFFTSCPTICPKVKQQMLRIHEKFKDNPKVQLVSHTIDVRHDTVEELKSYSNKLGITNDRWNFLTGDETALYAMAEEYFIVAQKDPDAPGGFDHSGRLILVDQNRHVRSFCNGVDPASVDGFMKDIELLLNED